MRAGGTCFGTSTMAAEEDTQPADLDALSAFTGERQPKVPRTEMSMESIMERMMAQQQRMMAAMMEQQAKLMMEQQTQMMKIFSTQLGQTAGMPSLIPTSTPTTSADEEDKAKAKELKKQQETKERAELEKELNKSRTKFEKKVTTFLKTKEMTELRAKESSLMEADETFEKYPEPMKAFKASPTEAELDNTWSKTQEGPETITIQIPKGTTRRRAMAIMHHQMVRLHKLILLEYAQEKHETLKKASRYDTFSETVKKVVQEFYEKTNNEEMGLDQIEKSAPPHAWIEAKVEAMYPEVIAKAHADKADEDKKKEDEHKKRKEAERKVLQTKPELALAQFVDERIARSEGIDIMDTDEAPPLQPATVVKALKESMQGPKNEQGDVGKGARRSPTGPSWKGPSGTASPKSHWLGWRIGNGKGKHKGKGKSKGKGKGKASGKGGRYGEKAGGQKEYPRRTIYK